MSRHSPLATRHFLVSALFSLLGLLAPDSAHGQVTYTSPQNVQATLATSLQCTGSAQTFATSSPTLNNLGFRNLGQTQHFITISGAGNTFLQAEIDGIDTQGNVTRISDVLEVPSTAPNGALSGFGYWPNIQIKVTCSSNVGSTFTLSYSGTSATFPQNVGGALTSQIDKLSFIGQAANANVSDNYQTPYGNSFGQIFFANNITQNISTLTVTCSGNGLTLSTSVFTLAQGTNTQIIPVLAAACPRITLAYTSGGATAATFTLEYVFYPPGTQNSLSSANLGSSSAPPIQVISDTIALAGYGYGTLTNPTTNQVLVHTWIPSTAKQIYFDRVVISTNTAIELKVNQTTTSGTCTGLTSVNLKTGANGSLLSATDQGCSVLPSVAGTLDDLFLAANTTQTVDLRGLIASAANAGVEVIVPTATTAVVTAVTYFYEK